MLAPRHFVDVRVEMVVPALATLLPRSPRQLRRDAAPLLRSNLAHELRHARIILCRPGTLRASVEDLGPSVEALHIRLALDILSHLLWRRGKMGVYKSGKV